MSINVPHIAKLANLPLRKEEIEKFEKQLAETLDYVAELEEIDTKNIKPTSQVTGLENITREDETFPSLSQEEALQNAPLRQGSAGQAKSTYNGFFKVKAILDE